MKSSDTSQLLVAKVMTLFNPVFQIQYNWWPLFSNQDKYTNIITYIYKYNNIHVQFKKDTFLLTKSPLTSNINYNLSQYNWYQDNGILFSAQQESSEMSQICITSNTNLFIHTMSAGNNTVIFLLPNESCLTRTNWPFLKYIFQEN